MQNISNNLHFDQNEVEKDFFTRFPDLVKIKNIK